MENQTISREEVVTKSYETILKLEKGDSFLFPAQNKLDRQVIVSAVKQVFRALGLRALHAHERTGIRFWREL
jgi:hypothetical protein